MLEHLTERERNLNIKEDTVNTREELLRATKEHLECNNNDHSENGIRIENEENMKMLLEGKKSGLAELQKQIEERQKKLTRVEGKNRKALAEMKQNMEGKLGQIIDLLSAASDGTLHVN
jgi:hypothetical protein